MSAGMMTWIATFVIATSGLVLGIIQFYADRREARRYRGIKELDRECSRRGYDIHPKTAVFKKPAMPVKLLGICRNPSGGWGVLDSNGVVTGHCPTPADADRLLKQNGGTDQ